MQRLAISLAVVSTTAVLWLAAPGDVFAQLPSWYVSFDALALDRDAPGPPPPAPPLPPPPPPPEEEEFGEPAWDVGFGLESNFRVKIFHEPAPCHAWEFSFLRNEWDYAQTVVDPNNNINKVLGAAAFRGANRASVQYDTELNTLEINRHFGAFRDCSVFWGFRALWFDEDFRMTSRVPGVGAGTYDIETENGLYGGQIGATYHQWPASDLWVSVTGKAGLFGNDAQQRVALVDPAFNSRYTNSDTMAAFVGEIDVNATYFVYSDFAVRVGFLMLWVDSVALALEQFQNTTAALPAPIDATGSLFAYGFYVGGQASW